MINVYKSPISKEKYANLFLDKIPEGAKNVCLLFIGHSETVHYIMSQKPEIDFTVIDGSDVTEALPYIYTADNLKERITFEESDCEDETFLKKLETCFENYIMNNMSFDLIIANPPYGKRGTLATTIIKSFMKFAEECSVLCQPRSIEKPGVYEHVIKADIVDNIFDAGLGKLAVSKIRNDYTEGKQVLYGKREIQETDITFQIRKFNENKVCWRTVPHCACSPAKYKNLVESKKSFVFFGNFELGNAITENGESTGYRYNVKKESIVWAGTVDPKHPEKGVLKNGKDCYAWDCETERSKENFVAVYYDIPKTGFFSTRNTQTSEFWCGRETAFDFCPMIDWEHLDESPLWNMSKEKAFLVELIKEGGQKIVLAYLKAKNENLDWSKPWTDSEILKDIGLPEDFLEKE